MTVKELIAKLQEYPPDCEVEIEMWEGYAEIKPNQFYKMEVENPQKEIIIINTTE